MGFGLAFKAFIKAFKDPQKTEEFLKDNSFTSIEMLDQSHIRLLNYLQQARLIDFLKEDITPFTDAQVGAAVRKIHQGCSQSLEELMTIRPLRDETEGTTVQIPKGYDSSEIKLVGKVRGEAPYTGVVVHRGWKALKRSLPKKTGETITDIICPAEIEVK
ncbi:DUF2760 domain-containing protein [Candidatus Protochlamydia amoebophila]|nr:DUF2760 domain-containing protein [Candidatus Protochlamydia amoebophila]